MSETPVTQRQTPHNTYRLQIRESFDLHAATQRLGYLHDLGVDWVYLSPLLEAEPGSDHGYDVVAHDRIDPARGGPEGLAALSAEARRLGMGVLVDIVPNHVGIATPSANAWWWDVLTHGRESRYADAFDIDWEAGDGKILIPIVGDDDEAAITLDAAAGEVTYHDHRFPVAPRTRSLDKQHYRLVSWRAADEALNYRRFFAVNTLAAVRVEERWVFDETHVEIKRWFDDGLVDGLRVDHPDGLRDPEGYLRDLASLTGSGDGAYVLVEKILEPGEILPSSWLTAGTTGYDALGHIDRVLTASVARGDLPHDDVDWSALTHATKRAVADGILGSEVRRIVRELPTSELSAVGAKHARGLVSRLRTRLTATQSAPLGLPGPIVIDAVAELLACFGVYRSYLPVTRVHLDEAIERARTVRPDLAAAFDALAPVLGDAEQPAALRFQQTSGMVMAKGVEDCAFYRYSRLTSLNEVGGDPSEHHLSVPAFHETMRIRQRDRPFAMTCTSTHDTKRGEDVRARIAVLAEVPDLWTAALRRLTELTSGPDDAFAGLLWQAVLGAWDDQDDDLRPRLHAYAEKAMREAGEHTQWTAPDETYEAAVHAAVDAAFDSPEVGEVLRKVLDEIVEPGWSNALSAKLIALSIPGVPDVYQGSELWEQSLVDPDNRRQVDFDLRARLLGERSTSRRSDHPARGKLATTTAALHLRRDQPELFTSYEPVTATGEAAEHLVAFDRGGAIALATRLPVGLAARGGWGSTELVLPAGRWWDHVTDRDLTSDGSVLLSEVLDVWPVALLTQADGDD